MIKIAVLGYGTVGSGVHELIQKNAESIKKKAGKKISVKYILDIRDFSDHPQSHLFTTRFEDILSDPEVTLVAEVIGGINPAYEYTKAALMAGKHVVTSNKELVASHGAELLAIAKEKNINYMFEASVGGGIPIIRPLHQCLAANEISEVTGILNGTTNYILTSMVKGGASFSDALKSAQEKGYAERNPAADVEGFDAQRKIAILMSLVSGRQMALDCIETEGITNLDATDVSYAKAMGRVIKLIGYGRMDGDKAYARVSPAMLDVDHPLATVEDVFNGILVRGDAIGDVMFYGRGAGKLPTASAVVADVIDIVKNAENHRLFWDVTDKAYIADSENAEITYFIRVKDTCRDKVTEIFGKGEFVSCGAADEIGFVCPKMKKSEFDKKASSLPCLIKKIVIA